MTISLEGKLTGPNPHNNYPVAEWGERLLRHDVTRVISTQVAVYLSPHIRFYLLYASAFLFCVVILKANGVFTHGGGG
jgi:hypothetical protein